MKYLILLCALALPAALHAQTSRTWTAAAGPWSTAANWSPSGVPGNLDSVIIGMNTAATLDVDTSIAALTFNGGSLLGQAGNPRSLTLSGGLGITTSSAWLGGTAPMTITANGGMSHSTVANFDNLTLNLPVGTTFTQSFTGGSSSQGRNGAVINNAGTWNATNTSGLLQSTGTLSSFNNAGIFSRTTSTSDWNCSWAFNNSGTVIANTGNMNLTGGGAAMGGSFLIASGATVKFQGTHSFDAASSISGAGRAFFVTSGSSTLASYDVTGITEMQFGTVTFNNLAEAIGELKMTGGTGNFNGTASPTALTMSGGAASFANSVSLPAGAVLNGGTLSIATSKTFTIPGSVTWNGSTLSGGGTFFLNGGGTATTGAMTVNGAVVNLPSGQTFTNSNAGGGGFTLSNGAVVNNAGTWEVTSISPISNGGGATVAFNNSGTFTKRVGTSNVNVNVPFHNSGTVNAQTGTLSLTGGGTQSGAFNISAGATLLLQGNQSFSGTPSFAGAGTVQFNANNPLTLTSYDVTGGTTVSFSTVTLNNGAGNIGAVTMTGGTGNFNGTASPTALTVNGGSANFANNITVAGTATLNGGVFSMPAGRTAALNGTVSWAGCTLSGGGTYFMNSGGSTSSGAPKLYGSVLNLPTGQTYVDSYNSGGGSVELRGGAVINNAGTWEYLGDRSIYNGLAPMSSFNNTGTFTKRNNTSSTLNIQIPFNNSGTVNASAGTLRMTGQSFTQTAGQLVLNGGIMRAAFGLPLLIQGGAVTGSGTIEGGVSVTGGTMKPRGTLALVDTDSGSTKGDLTLTSASTLDVELGGTTAGTLYDRVTEQGNVAFTRNGTLVVRFKNGFHYTALAADTFTILTSNQNTTGQFSNVSGGRITTADFKGTFAINAAGSTSVVLSDYQAYPDLDVEQPAGTDLADGAATVPFGLKTIGTPGVVKTFTIKNSGAVSLTGLAVTIDGTHAADFSVTTPLPGSTLASEGTETFIVTFTPSGSGMRTAALHIASNDPNEAPFDIALTGEGNFAPVLSLPLTDVEAEPDDINGAVVNFSVSATDFEDDPDPTAIASPASGSQFPLGDSTVIVTATDSRGVTTTGTFTVRVLGGDPSATTLAPNAITINSATLRASVNPNHFATSVQFVMDGNPLNPPVNVPAGSSPVTVTFPVSGLDPGSAHTANVQAINATGQFISGGTVPFTTLGGPPAVTTTAPTMITPTKARLTATVNPNDLPTTVSFYIGQQLLGTVNVPAGSSPQTVTFDYQQLIPGQAVTFNAIAINQLAQTGVSGNDLTFNLLPSNTSFGSSNSHLYAANAGWINAKPASSYGFRTGDTVCSGFLYAANFGWIHAGTGEPTNGIRYTNIGSDYGINVMPDGTLRGYAWGQNIGWISFENTGNPRINFISGALEGHAWSGNIGWITLSTATTTQLAILDTDGDGISDHWEMEAAGNLTTLGANRDTDGDGVSDYDEFTADTDPLVPGDQFKVSDLAELQASGEMVITFPSWPSRLYQVITSDTLTAQWNDIGLGWFPGSPSGYTQVNLGVPAEQRGFFRVVANRPLAGP
jgi:hypothetical protein